MISSDESGLLYCTDHSALTSYISVVACNFSTRVHFWIIIKINSRFLCILGYFMFFLLVFRKCLDVYIESVLSNWDSTVSSFLGKPPVLFDRILIWVNALRKILPCFRKIHFEYYPPSTCLQKFYSSDCYRQSGRKTWRAHVILKAGRIWEGNISMYLKELGHRAADSFSVDKNRVHWNRLVCKRWVF